jgi:hypothetical protein
MYVASQSAVLFLVSDLSKVLVRFGIGLGVAFIPSDHVSVFLLLYIKSK